MQSLHPDRPYTRLVKDVLRVGKWLATTSDGGQSEWVVTRETLQGIANTFRMARQNGVDPNLIWDHGSPLTGLVSGRDLITSIDDLRVEGDVLWCSLYCTPQQARTLSHPVHKVSIGYEPVWRDGRGRQYRHFLSHVGVVDLPVVDSQGPFLTLSRRKGNTMPIPRMGRARRLALSQLGFRLATEGGEGEEAATEETIEPGAQTVEGDGVETLIDLIDQLLMEGMGIGLPEGTTGETLVHDLQVLTHALFKPAEEPTPEATAEPAAEVAAEQMALSTRAIGQAIQAAIAPLQRQIRTLSAGRTAQRTTVSNSAAEAYRAELDRLAADGNIDAATRLDLLEQGAETGYRLSTLAPFKRTTMVRNGSRAKALATGRPPATNGRPNPDRVKKLVEVGLGKRSMDDPDV